MMGHKIHFSEEIWLIIPVIPSYLEHCYDFLSLKYCQCFFFFVMSVLS